MSNQRISRHRLAQVASLFALVLCGCASAGIPDVESGVQSAMVMSPLERACGSDDSHALISAPENLCVSGSPSSVSGTGPWTWTCTEGHHQTRCGANVGAHYIYTTFDYPGSTRTIIWGLNDLGDFAGEYRVGGTVSHAMVHRNGHFESLDPNGLFGDRFAAAGGPNDLGTVYGGYADVSGLQHGFQILWGHEENVDFGSHLNSNVDGINLFGAIAGVYWDADGIFHGVLRRYGHDTAIDFPGARDTYPLGISDNGELVGYTDTNPAQPHGFYRSANGQYTQIDVPAALATAAFAINGTGQIAGYYADAAGVFHGFIKTRGQFQYLDVPGAKSTFTTALNNFGVVAGEYLDAAGVRHGFVATPW